MLPENRKRILEHAAVSSTTRPESDGYVLNQLQPSWHEVSIEGADGLRFVIANMEAQDLAFPKIASYKSAESQPFACFLVSEAGNDFPQLIVDAHKRGVCTVVFRNDAESAAVAIRDLLRVFTSGFHRSVDAEDFRCVAEKSVSAILPTVVAGSGTAQGNNGGVHALDIALINVELLKSKNFEKAHGIFVAISCSQRIMKMSIYKKIINQVREKCCYDDSHFSFGADYDESIGDSWRVTVIVAV